MTRFILPAVAALAILLSVWLAYANFQYAGKLAEARALVTEKISIAKGATARSQLALLAAAEDSARADSAIRAAEAYAARARALKTQLAQVRTQEAADTAALLAKVLDERDLAVLESASWQSAFEEQVKATAALEAANGKLKVALNEQIAATEGLQGSAGKLVDATQRKFWDRFVPKLAINATIGVDPLQPEQGIKKVVGIGASWTL